MTVIITVEFTQETYRGRDGRPGRVAWPPSPARLAGALLAGAHTLSSDCDSIDERGESARTALAYICSAGQPWIAAPLPPRELDANRLQWFAPDHFDDEKQQVKGLALRDATEPPVGADAKNKVVKERVLALLAQGSTVHYLIDAELADPAQRRALVDAAEAVPFFGTASDQAQLRATFEDVPVAEVCRTLTRRNSTGFGLQVWRAVSEQLPARRGDRTLRGWSKDTVAFYDAVHARGGAPVTGDVRIPETRYRIDNTYSTDCVATGDAEAPPAESASHVVIREFPRGPVSMRTFAELASRISKGLDDVNVRLLPALDRNRRDSVRGVIFTGLGRWEALRAADGIVTADPVSDAVSLHPATWCGPSPLWESASPAASHRNPGIAREHIEHDLQEHGLRLVAISPNPWQPWHSKRLAVGDEYGLWFVTAESDKPVTGPISVGSYQQSGAGLLAPADTLAVPR